MRTQRTAGLLLAVCSLFGCGDRELIENPMIDRWCGDKPCAWEVTGDVERVGTWHTDDYAVELKGRNASISQYNATVDATDATCLGFTMIADVSRSAKVFVELDFLNDGVIEFSQQMPESRWERRTFLIATPSWYEGVRFIVRKQGSGRAVLAELRAREETGCKRAPVELLNRPDGARCEADDQCASDRCRRGRCSYCQSEIQCSTGQICGLSYSSGTVAERCVRPKSAEFGQVCSSDAQCETGSCCEGVCSQCCPDKLECDDEQTCARAGNAPIRDVVLPHQCAPGEGLTRRGEPCVAGQDCQSNACTGAVFQCASCPGDTGDDAGVEVTECELGCTDWSFRGGTCN